MIWGGGGGGGSGAVGNAAAAIVAGYAKYCVVFRALAQGQFGRFGQAPGSKTVSGPAAYTSPYGLMSPRNGSRCARAASCTITASTRSRWRRSRWPTTITRSSIRAP